VVRTRKKSAPIEVPRIPWDCEFQNPNGSWQHGHYRSRTDDGFVVVVECKTGATRTIAPEKVRWSVKGPRGGQSKVLATEAVRPLFNMG